MTIVQKIIGWFFGRCLPERSNVLESQLEEGLLESDVPTTFMQHGLNTLKHIFPRFMNTENNGGEYWALGDGMQQSNSPSYVPPTVVYNSTAAREVQQEEAVPVSTSLLPDIH